MTKEIFGLSGREEILATQEVLADVAKMYTDSKFEQITSDCEELLTQDDEMDMSGAGGPGDDR